MATLIFVETEMKMTIRLHNWDTTADLLTFIDYYVSLNHLLSLSSKTFFI